MLRLISLCLFFLFLPKWGNTQKISNVNFNEIKSAITDSSSTLYYPTLIDRIVKRDTTLTAKEFKHLYYGNVFQSYYYPYGATEKQKLFFEQYKSGNNFAEIESLGLAVLEENPVDLDVLLKMILLYNQEKKVNKAILFAKLYVSFLEVIYASGDGKKNNSSFVVISVDDEYRIVGDLGLTVLNQSLVGYSDRLIFSRKGQKRKNRIKELYFNVRMPLTYLSKSFNDSDLPIEDADPDLEEKD